MAIAYFAIRIVAPGDWPIFMRSIGLGFREVGEAELREQYSAFPYFIYAYNVAATALNAIAGEPSRGVFMITARIREGTATLWQWNQLLGSLATTAVLLCWGAVAWRRRREPEHSANLRMFLVLCAAVVLTALLGYNYTRDRFNGVPVVFYALAAYHAALWLIDTAAASRRRTVFATAAMVLLVLSALAPARDGHDSTPAAHGVGEPQRVAGGLLRPDTRSALCRTPALHRSDAALVRARDQSDRPQHRG